MSDKTSALTGENERVRDGSRCIPDEVVQTYLRAVDVVVLSSRRTPTPERLLPATASAGPVIEPDSGCGGGTFLLRWKNPIRPDEDDSGSNALRETVCSIGNDARIRSLEDSSPESGWISIEDPDNVY